MSYTLATAAEAAKVTKPTVFRWIKSGKITAAKAEDGTYRIDPAELHRYLDNVAKQPAQEAVQQTETLAETAATPAGTLQDAIALRYEVEKLRVLLEAERQRAEAERERAAEWKVQADRWAAQAERLALPAPVPNGESELREERDYWRAQAEQLASSALAATETAGAPRRRWWRWRSA
jgi:excisionase family DNA binding protein